MLDFEIIGHSQNKWLTETRMKIWIKIESFLNVNFFTADGPPNAVMLLRKHYPAELLVDREKKNIEFEEYKSWWRK